MEKEEVERLQKLAVVFGKLNTTDEDVLKNEVLDLTLLLKGDVGYRLLFREEVRQILTNGLGHPSSTIRQVTLNQLARCTTNLAGVNFLINTQLLDRVLVAIKDTDVGTAEQARVIIESIGATLVREDNQQALESFAKILNSNEASTMFGQMLDDKTLQFRVMVLFINLSVLSPFLLNTSTRYLLELMNRVKTDDVLILLNVFELLPKLLSAKHGVEFFNNNKNIILPTLLSILSSNDPFKVSLLTGNALRLLGVLISSSDAASILSAVPIFQLLGSYIHGNLSDKEAAITTIGNIGSSVTGATALLSAENNALLSDYFENIRSSQDLHKRSFIQSLGVFWTCRDHNLVEQSYNRAESILKEDLMSIFFKTLQSTDEELRFVTFYAIQSLTQHPFGINKIFNEAGFYEYLTNRESEKTKLGKEWKFGIISGVVQNHDQQFLAKVIGTDNYNELVKYVRTGVYGIKPKSTVEVIDEAL